MVDLLTARPMIVRSTDDIVSVLMSLPAEWRDQAFADQAYAEAISADDADEALFWSEVLMLLRCVDEAGISVSDGAAAPKVAAEPARGVARPARADGKGAGRAPARRGQIMHA